MKGGKRVSTTERHVNEAVMSQNGKREDDDEEEEDDNAMNAS